MRYTLPLEEISLADYRQLLQRQTLLPGRRMLLEQIENRFALLANSGLMNASQLSYALASPAKLSALCLKTGIPEDYLTILRRELGSLTQKPVPLADFPGCEGEKIRALALSGIRSSRDYWESAVEHDSVLYALSDLVRINGVGAVAARAFYEAGYASVAAVSQAKAPEMLLRVSAINAEKGYYKATLGEKDMQFCIDYAALLMRYR